MDQKDLKSLYDFHMKMWHRGMGKEARRIAWIASISDISLDVMWKMDAMMGHCTYFAGNKEKYLKKKRFNHLKETEILDSKALNFLLENELNDSLHCLFSLEFIKKTILDLCEKEGARRTNITRLQNGIDQKDLKSLYDFHMKMWHQGIKKEAYRIEGIASRTKDLSLCVLWKMDDIMGHCSYFSGHKEDYIQKRRFDYLKQTEILDSKTLNFLLENEFYEVLHCLFSLEFIKKTILDLCEQALSEKG